MKLVLFSDAPAKNWHHISLLKKHNQVYFRDVLCCIYNIIRHNTTLFVCGFLSKIHLLVIFVCISESAFSIISRMVFSSDRRYVSISSSLSCEGIKIGSP